MGVDEVQVKHTVESATDYYPYGKALRSYGQERYQSTYHERDVESGFDYRGARFYDGDIVRFNSLDPLAAEFPEWSDYNYVLGNPIIFIDPNGKRTIYYNEDGQELHRSEDGLDDAIVIISNENLDAFYAEWDDVDVCSSECETHFNSDDVNGKLRGLGTNYMVDGMIKLLEISLETPASKVGYRMKDGSDMYSEYVAELIVTNNTVSVDMSTANTDRYPDGVMLPSNDSSIHTHPNGYSEKGVETTENGWETSDDFGGSEGAPPSAWDQTNRRRKNTNIRDVTVSPSTIWLYNGQDSQNIATPIKFFQNKK